MVNTLPFSSFYVVSIVSFMFIGAECFRDVFRVDPLAVRASGERVELRLGDRGESALVAS